MQVRRFIDRYATQFSSLDPRLDQTANSHVLAPTDHS